MNLITIVAPPHFLSATTNMLNVSNSLAEGTTVQLWKKPESS